MDILEYVNDIPSQTSFHTGKDNHCRVYGGEVNYPGCPVMPDLNGMNFECNTSYPDALGCAINRVPLRSAPQWADNPGVVAMEWTKEFIKVFFIPEAEIPSDLSSDVPRPDSWDGWLISYYPLGPSDRHYAGDCPNPGDAMQAQKLILNMNFCGDWAGKIWADSPQCVNHVGPQHPQQCRAVDPLFEYAPAEDCCTQFIADENDEFGTAAHLAERAFFNISWVKVWQEDHRLI